MPSIYYEQSGGDVYQIDDVSQRLLVYVYIHGRTRAKTVVEPVGARDEHTIYSRIESQLGESAADLIDVERSAQQTLGDAPNSRINELVLTDQGKRFVETHRSDLSMPVKIAELAKEVSSLRIEDHMVDELINRVEVLENRLDEVER